MDTWHVRNRYIQNVGGQIGWKEITSRICRIIFKCVVRNVVGDLCWINSVRDRG